MQRIFAGLVLAGLLASPLAAQDASEGKSLYEQYCATCHGLDGTGNGPMSPVLVLQPPDLTVLQSTNEGKFPLFRVISRIDGRDPLVSHGSPMPIYGDFFEGRDVALKTEAGQPIMTSEPIADLVDWLKSIQQ